MERPLAAGAGRRRTEDSRKKRVMSMRAESKGSPSRVKRVVTLSSGVSTDCEHCEAPIRLGRLDESVNHYLTEHAPAPAPAA